MTAPIRRRQMKSMDKPKPFWWFTPQTVRELYDRITEAGPDSCRLEVHLTGQKMTLEIIGQADEAAAKTRVQPLNDSRVCPPICPH